jgi:hypothetical protein
MRATHEQQVVCQDRLGTYIKTEMEKERKKRKGASSRSVSVSVSRRAGDDADQALRRLERRARGERPASAALAVHNARGGVCRGGADGRVVAGRSDCAEAVR